MKRFNKPAIILGTGPSLAAQRDAIISLRLADKVRLFGINNTTFDFPLDVWIACDPAWHDHYGQVSGDFDKWHWDKGICERYGYNHIEGRWADGLSTDPGVIHYGHSSGYQALGLAVHYGCPAVYLCGFDMRYGDQRHYFEGLSGDAGEYPQPLRKFSAFDKPRVPKGHCRDYSLFQCYESVADQRGLPAIINTTRDSALTCFPFGDLPA
ncbi:MAG: hypothetical protein EP334_10010 [Gammaproteobacteria bacterium]|nr:MAG: hypothetical protein EP334_10010 [Gammaproteobacteria bacterium]